MIIRGLGAQKKETGIPFPTLGAPLVSRTRTKSSSHAAASHSAVMCLGDNCLPLRLVTFDCAATIVVKIVMQRSLVRASAIAGWCQNWAVWSK